MKKPRGRPPGTKRFDIYFTMRIDAAMHETLSRVAEEEDRPVASMARVLLKEALQARKAGEEASRTPKKKGK